MKLLFSAKLRDPGERSGCEILELWTAKGTSGDQREKLLDNQHFLR